MKWLGAAVIRDEMLQDLESETTMEWKEGVRIPNKNKDRALKEQFTKLLWKTVSKTIQLQCRIHGWKDDSKYVRNRVLNTEFQSKFFIMYTLF